MHMNNTTLSAIMDNDPLEQTVNESDVSDLVVRYITSIRDIEYFLHNKLKSMVMCSHMKSFTIDDNHIAKYDNIKSIGLIIDEIELLINKQKK